MNQDGRSLSLPTCGCHDPAAVATDISADHVQREISQSTTSLGRISRVENRNSATEIARQRETGTVCVRREKLPGLFINL